MEATRASVCFGPPAPVLWRKSGIEMSFVVSSASPCGTGLGSASFQLLSALSDGQLFVLDHKPDVEQAPLSLYLL